MVVITTALMILFFSGTIHSCEVFNSTDFLREETLLYNSLMKDYNHKLPIISTIDSRSQATGAHLPRFEVSLLINFLQLISVVESQQKVDFILEYKLKWSDKRLQWSPSDYCGINQLYLAREDVWIPEVTIVDVLSTIDHREDFQKFVWLNSSGSLEFFVPTVTSIACKIKIRDFPFDVQTCTIKVMAQTFLARRYGIEANFFTTNASRIAKMGNGEWQIKNVSVWTKPEENTDGLLVEINYFDVSMKRNPVFYVTVVISPSFIINVLCIFGLFLRADRMAKLGMALTNVMSVTFILGILATVLPKTDEIPKIAIFVAVNLALMVTSLGIILLLPYVRLQFRRRIDDESTQKKEKFQEALMTDRSKKRSVGILDIALLIFLQLANLTNFLVLIL